MIVNSVESAQLHNNIMIIIIRHRRFVPCVTAHCWDDKRVQRKTFFVIIRQQKIDVRTYDNNNNNNYNHSLLLRHCVTFDPILYINQLFTRNWTKLLVVCHRHNNNIDTIYHKYFSAKLFALAFGRFRFPLPKPFNDFVIKMTFGIRMKVKKKP